MEIFTYLILGHFIADYPLQPGWLVAMKKNLKGLFIHTLIHLVITIVLIFPYWHLKEAWWAIAIVFLTHTAIDFTKVRIEKKYPKKALLWYLLDQLAHVSIIGFVYCLWLKGATPVISKAIVTYYQNLSVPNFFLTLVLVTFVYDVSRWIYLNSRKKQPYVRDWRGMGRNALIVVIGFGVYWIFG